MDLPVISILSTVVFGLIAIIYTVKEEKLKKQLEDKKTYNYKPLYLLDCLEDGFFTIDQNSQIIFINKKAKDILKLTKDDPTIIDILSSLPNTYNFTANIKKVFESNQKIEVENVNFNDKWFNIAIHPEFSRDTDHKTIAVSFLIRDITIAKSHPLMKQDFTRIIAHELRSPLTSIRASSEMLNGQNNLTDEEKASLLKIIGNQTVKMLDEVSLILDAAHLESGLFTIQKTTSDIKKIIEETISSFRDQAQKKSITLTVDISASMPQIEIDSYQIRRVISNLLENSLKFTPTGGNITIQAVPQTDRILIKVLDTGCGIPQDKQHLIFTKFCQIQNPNAAIGIGLGLYVVKGIIEAHGGSVEFNSEEGKGTTFSFSIPLRGTHLAQE